MASRAEPAGVGSGILLKSNQTSSDNTLAFPVGPGSLTYKKPNHLIAHNTNKNNSSSSSSSSSKTTNFDSNTGSTQVAGGGTILKSNNTSNDNPLTSQQQPISLNGSLPLLLYLNYNKSLKKTSPFYN